MSAQKPPLQPIAKVPLLSDGQSDLSQGSLDFAKAAPISCQSVLHDPFHIIHIEPSNVVWKDGILESMSSGGS